MVKIIGKTVRVVDFEGITIDEHAGNASTKEDTLSIATVNISKPASEPWLTLEYDEWLCVRKGYIEIHTSSSTDELSVLKVSAGETVFIAKGERFKPVFPVGGTEYIPVCLPAFSPDRCHREEEEVSEVTLKLRKLHGETPSVISSPAATKVDDMKDNAETSEQLFHMCEAQVWNDSVAKGEAYFPPTFVKDGMYTHATAVPQRLITTANHYYTSTIGDWICLELSRSALLKLGIDTVFEEAMPVGDISVSNQMASSWICPHIYGGIPTHIDGVITKVYNMERKDDGTFLCITGLTE